MSRPLVHLELQTWAYRRPFAISRGVLKAQTVLHARADTPWGGVQGEGEPHESDDGMARSMLDRGLSWVGDLQGWPSRAWLRDALPADGLRHALDALLWDVECKRAGRRAWELAGLEGVNEASEVPTMVTVTLDSPAAMAQRARQWASAPVIKLKLGEPGAGGLDRDIERTRAVADAAPDAGLVLDANEGWTPGALRRFVDATRQLDIRLIEQPLPAGSEDLHDDLTAGVPLAADESCTTLASLDRLRGRFHYVNIKLDKSGGLTEALMMVDKARDLGLRVMVGCNCGTSLAMASAFVLATQCDLVDLDGPLHLQGDRSPPVRYRGHKLQAPDRALWG